MVRDSSTFATCRALGSWTGRSNSSGRTSYSRTTPSFAHRPASAGDGDLVETFPTENGQGPLGSPDAGEREFGFRPDRDGRPHDLAGRPAGLVSGPRMLKMVRAQLPPHRRGVLHGTVVIRRKHEADADFIDALAHLLGLEIDVGPRASRYVGAARLTGNRAPAVLGDPAPAAAATNMAAVEILKVWAPSPPVPQVSTRRRDRRPAPWWTVHA